MQTPLRAQHRYIFWLSVFSVCKRRRISFSATWPRTYSSVEELSSDGFDDAVISLHLNSEEHGQLQNSFILLNHVTWFFSSSGVFIVLPLYGLYTLEWTFVFFQDHGAKRRYNGAVQRVTWSVDTQQYEMRGGTLKTINTQDTVRQLIRGALYCPAVDSVRV